MLAPPKIFVTKNYSLFAGGTEQNRQLELAKHKKLRESMKKNGFVPSFPIVVRRHADGVLEIYDGQHRFAFAVELELPVYYVEDKGTWDVAEINSTAKTWTLADYAKR